MQFVFALIAVLATGRAFAQPPAADNEPQVFPAVVGDAFGVGFKLVEERHEVIAFHFESSAILPRIMRVSESSNWRACDIPPGLAVQLQTRATQVVQQMNEVCRLSPEQSKKLALAAALEQRKILRQIKKIVSDFDGAPYQSEATQLFDQMRKLRMRVQAPPGDGSPLFVNVLDQVLTAEQHRELANFHVTRFLKSVARSAVLDDAESRKLRELLFDAAENVVSEGNRKDFLILVVAKLDLPELEQKFGQRSGLAIIRFCNYFQEH